MYKLVVTRKWTPFTDWSPAHWLRPTRKQRPCRWRADVECCCPWWRLPQNRVS